MNSWKGKIFSEWLNSIRDMRHKCSWKYSLGDFDVLIKCWWGLSNCYKCRTQCLARKREGIWSSANFIFLKLTHWIHNIKKNETIQREFKKKMRGQKLHQLLTTPIKNAKNICCFMAQERIPIFTIWGYKI